MEMESEVGNLVGKANKRTFFCFSFSNVQTNSVSNLHAIATRAWSASMAVTDSPSPNDRKRVR